MFLAFTVSQVRDGAGGTVVLCHSSGGVVPQCSWRSRCRRFVMAQVALLRFVIVAVINNYDKL